MNGGERFPRIQGREEKAPQEEGAVQNRRASLGVARSLICGVNEVNQENKLEMKAEDKGDYLKR